MASFYLEHAYSHYFDWNEQFNFLFCMTLGSAHHSLPSTMHLPELVIVSFMHQHFTAAISHQHCSSWDVLNPNFLVFVHVLASQAPQWRFSVIHTQREITNKYDADIVDFLSKKFFWEKRSRNQIERSWKKSGTWIFHVPWGKCRASTLAWNSFLPWPNIPAPVSGGN